MKKFLFIFLAVMPLLFTNCKKSSDETYLFHFKNSGNYSYTGVTGDAVKEIMTIIDFDTYFEYTTTREKAIASAQIEYDNAISKITKDYTDCFGNGQYFTVSMEMFAPDTYVVDTKTWGNKE